MIDNELSLSFSEVLNSSQKLNVSNAHKWTKLPTIVGEKVEICKSEMPENALNLHTIVREILKIESLKYPTEFTSLT